MERKLDNWILVFILFSGLGDKHTRWASTVRNASQKDAEPPEFSTITMQVLEESRILAKSSAGTDTTMAFIGKQLSNQKFSSTMSSNTGPSTKRSSPLSETNSKKAGYNKEIAKCTHCYGSNHAVDHCWFLHPEKAKASWLACNPAESAEKPINLLKIGTLPSNLVETTASLPTKPRLLPPEEQSTFLPDTLVSSASGISFTMPEDNEPMPTDLRVPSSISFEGISESDLDLLDTFS